MNSIGTNTSCVGAVHELPTGYCTRPAIRYAITVTTNGQAENDRVEELKAASAPGGEEEHRRRRRPR